MHLDLDLQAVLARAYGQDTDREAIRARLLRETERRSRAVSMATGMGFSMLLLLARAVVDVLRGRPTEVMS